MESFNGQFLSFSLNLETFEKEELKAQWRLEREDGKQQERWVIDLEGWQGLLSSAQKKKMNILRLFHLQSIPIKYIINITLEISN